MRRTLGREIIAQEEERVRGEGRGGGEGKPEGRGSKQALASRLTHNPSSLDCFSYFFLLLPTHLCE